MTGFESIVCIALVAVMVVCAYRESAVMAEWHLIFGRPTAFLFADLALGGALLAAGSVLMLLAGRLAFGAMLGGAYLLYKRVEAMCGDAPVREILTALLTAGLGVNVKLCLFFVHGIWSYAGSDDLAATPAVLRDVETGEAFTVETLSGGAAVVRDGSHYDVHADGSGFVDSHGNHYAA